MSLLFFALPVTRLLTGSLCLCIAEQCYTLSSVSSFLEYWTIRNLSDDSTRFAKAARVEDFNLKDISSPERERTLILLSAFINFVKFTEQYCNSFVKDLTDRSSTLIVERDQISQQLAEVEQSIEEMRLASSLDMFYLSDFIQSKDR